ncbi:MAG TPA: prolyl oligopeptidase family serine peptidase, partial [Acidobacteriota bacterium]|nr:prolyl oligopeptidase family serine peptidase [Acidobacteriota bacterium]
MRKLILLVLTLSLTATWSSGQGTLTPENFLQYTIIANVAVSPDGANLAFTTQNDNFKDDTTHHTVWWFRLDQGRTAISRTIVAEGQEKNLRLGWSPDSRYLSYLRTGRGGLQVHLFDIGSSEDRVIDVAGVLTYDWFPEGSGLVVAGGAPKGIRPSTGLNYGDVRSSTPLPFKTAMYRIPIGETDIGDVAHFVTIARRVMGLSIAPNGKQIAYLSAFSGPPFYFDSVAPIEVFLLSLLGDQTSRQLTRNLVAETQIAWSGNSTLYASGFGKPGSESEIRTQARLYQLSVESGQMQTVAKEFSGEFGAPLGIMPFEVLSSGKLLATGNVSTRTQLLEVDVPEGTTRPLSDFDGDVANLSASADGEVIAFTLVTRDSFPEIYLASSSDRVEAAHQVTSFNADLNRLALPEIEKVQWFNADGDLVEGVLFWPPGQHREFGLPLVVDIHGGPWINRTEAIAFNLPNDYKYYPALLASQGYLVLEPNYRGSSGRGDGYLHAVEGYPLSRPVNDVLTGVDFLVSQGWADPNRMAVMGYSYGATVVNGIIVETDRFKAACSGAGIWNEISFFGASDAFYPTRVRHLGKAPWEEPQHYWEESAIGRIKNISTPTLVIHGDRDRAVPISQSHELFRTLEWLGVPSELLIFPDEGHSFGRPSHKMVKVLAEMSWLDKYLIRSTAISGGVAESLKGSEGD